MPSTTPGRTRLRLLIALAALGVASACGSPRPPNILMIVVDTLRADRLGAYGNTRGVTPFLDSLAARSYVFRRAYAQSSWTNPSVASLLTSRYPSQHGVVSFESVLTPGEITLAEVLKEHGYRTGAFSANGLLKIQDGFAQGFEEYRAYFAVGIKDRAERVDRESLAWLASAEPAKQAAPVFLYLQYMEPHIPYAPPDAALARVVGDRTSPDVAQVNYLAIVGHNQSLVPEALQDLEDVYDAEVLALDEALTAFFAELDRRGFLTHAVVVVTADHGDEFKEHGSLGHGKTLYEEVIRVPLLLHLPSQTRRTDIDAVVSLIDVAPTLLALAGIAPPAPFEGTSWMRTVLATPPASGDDHRPERSAYSQLVRTHAINVVGQNRHERALVAGNEKLIVANDGTQATYDLAADPGEHAPGAVTEVARQLLEQTLDWFAQHITQVAQPQDVKPLDEETRAKLRALGYAN